MERTLGAMETAMALTAEVAPFNIVTVLHLRGDLTAERLREAWRALRERHVLLDARVVLRDRKHRFVTGNSPEIEVRVESRPSPDHWLEVVEKELNQSFDASRGPLSRCVLVKSDTGADGVSEVVVTFNHAIVDAASGETLLRDLLAACGSATPATGGASRPPSLPASADDSFPAASRGPRQMLRTLRFLGAQAADEMVYRARRRNLRRPEITDGARCWPLTARSDREATRRLVREARRRRVTLNSVLGAAMLITAHRRAYGMIAGPLRHVTFAGLRPYLEPPRPADELGACLSMLRLTVPMVRDDDLWSVAGRINTAVHSGLRRGDKFTAHHLSPTMMRMMLGQRSERMGTTALSYGGVLRLEREHGSLRLEGVHAFVSNLDIGPEVTAQVRLFRDELWWDFVFLDGDFERDEARAVVADIVAAVGSGPAGGGA